MEDTIYSKTHQIMNLVVYIHKNSLYSSTLHLDGKQDTFTVKVINPNDKKIFFSKIDSFSKKNENIVLKELNKISDELITIKNKIDGLDKVEKKENKSFLIKLINNLC